jgi:hypothetical protein
MAVRNCWVEDTAFPCIRREHYRTLCHRVKAMGHAMIELM